MAVSRHKIGGKEVDPEVILKRKFQVKCRFRAIVRLAFENAYWLADVEEYEGVDVKKRVAQAMRTKTPKRMRLLSLADKALLNKPSQDRTHQEKLYLYRIIGGLKCFKRYPNNVKRKLAAATYFQYYKPGHVIVRQDQDAHAMYFIIAGDIVVTRMFFDELLNKYIPMEIGTMHAGDMFGEISLLHSIPRTATCTTLTHCELLILRKDEFKNILQASVQASWDKVLLAMSFFTYFDALDEVSRREGCIMAKMMSYSKNETILGDDVGVPNHVYFVLSGCCQMIESLRISSFNLLGRTLYKLFDPQVPKEDSEEDIQQKYFSGPSKANSILINRSADMATHLSNLSNLNIVDENFQKSLILSQHNDVNSNGSNDRIKPDNRNIDEVKLMFESIDKLKESKSGRSISNVEDLETQVLYRSKEQIRESVRFSNTKNAVGVIPNIRTYFMQVCQFNPGSSFGFGENMRDRRILALTPVKCMLMPKFWLQERNIANIWTRIQHFLQKKIPSKKELFQSFVMERRWIDYRNDIVEEVVARSNVANWTSIHDVPYCIRLEEMVDA